MKIIIILLLIVGLFTDLYAQDNFLILSGGISHPKNDFALTNITNTDAAFATQGYNMGFEMSYYVNDYIGFGANIRFYKIGYDKNAYNLVLEDNFEGRFETIKLNTDDYYSLQNFLFGPYIKYTFLDRISIYGKIFIGVMSSFKPNQLLEYNEAGLDLTEIELEGKIVASFAISFGVGMVVKITDRVGLCVSTDYIFAKPKFDKVDLETLEFKEENQTILLNNYNVGLALAF